MSDSLPTSSLTPARPAAPDFPAVILVHQAGRITHANSAAHALWQVAPGALTGEFFFNLFAAESTAHTGEPDPELWYKILLNLLDQEITLTPRHGGNDSSASQEKSPPPVRVRVEKLSDIIYLATLHPLETRAATTTLTEASLEPLRHHGAVGFSELNVKTGKATYSPTWKRMLGYIDEEFPDTIEAWRDLIHPDDSAAAPDQIGKKTTPSPRPFNVEFRMRHRTGHWLWVQCVGVQLLSDTGKVERVIGLHLDVSERKEIEEASLANDERMEQLSGTGLLGAFDLNFATKTFWFSPGWKTLLGYRENELSNDLATFSSTLPPDEQAGGVENWIQLRAPGQTTVVGPELLVGKDGRRVPVLLGLHRTLTRKRELARVVGFICAAPATGSSSSVPALMQVTFAALAEGILITNAEGKILTINPAACRLLRVKVEDVRDQLAAQVFRLVQRETGQPSDDPFTRALSETEPLPLITDAALPPGAAGEPPHPIVWTARTCRDANHRLEGVIIIFRDPAEISLTPEELLKANRLESLGVVAGGIAHDFNDLLTTILGGVSLAKDNQDPSALEESEKACLSARGLTKQLLAFAKGGSGAHSVMTADEVLHASIKLAAAGSDAEITVEVAEGTEPVRVDRLQIAQVFQNLILNALQAMPGPPHRARVHLRAANTTLAADQIPPLAAGAYVEFEVRDNASGVAPENQEKIFDPFFTTRKHGTGLGLATALSIVRKHGGQIGMVSTPGEGSAFTIFLPRADAPLQPQSQKTPSLRFRTGRILFMDDDPKITALTGTMLQSLDYKFDVTKDGAEAIQLYKRYFNIGRPYDAVILDITVVGGMGGEECFKALRDFDPEVRAIISTGYENDAMARRFLDEGFSGFLTKPYRIADLGKALKTVLT